MQKSEYKRYEGLENWIFSELYLSNNIIHRNQVEEELFNKIQNIEYTSANGLTYVTLILKKEKTNRIKITKK